MKKLYVMSAPSYGTKDRVKVGVSENPKKRLLSLRSTHDHLLKIVDVYDVEHPFESEAKVKKEFASVRIKGTEFFRANAADIVAFVKEKVLP